jgi:hypothetical protein
MSEYRKQVAFLKTLMTYTDTAEHQSLRERLAAVEKNEQCLFFACRLVGLIALLGLMGIGYSAVLLPEFFDNKTHVIIRFFSALGLGSTLCFGLFLGLWLYYRRAANRIHRECRQLVVTTLEARLKTTATTFYPVLMDAPNLKLATVQSPSLKLLSLPKAS